MNTNELGYKELVDTVADVIDLATKLGETFADGIQLSDAFVLLAEAQNIEEIYKDFPTAWAELKDLDPDEAKLAMDELAARLNAPEGSIIDIVEEGFGLVTKGYLFFADARAFVKKFPKAA